MGRLLRFTEGYAKAYSALRPLPAVRSALIKTARKLERGDLPEPSDFEALRWPVGATWVRKVDGARLWVLYDFDDETVTLHEIRRSKPVRVGG